MSSYFIIIIVVLICLSAFFSASETAYSSVNRIRLKNYAGNGNKRAEKALKITDNFDKTLSTILIGNNIVNIASASLGTVLFTELFGASGVGLSTFVMTVVVLIFGEILPKSVAKEKAETIALAVATPLSVLIAILTPLSFLFMGIKKGFMKLFKNDKKNVSVTEEELKYIIEEIEDEGVLEKQESELVQSALDFDEITADEILTPRVDLVSIDITETIEAIKTIFITEHFSRIPVYEKSVDNIIGVLYSKDFFTAYVDHPESISIRDMLQNVIFVPPKKKISALLSELQKLKSHIAVITDQYGGVMGIVTLEDILEELVGEIWDEYDDVEIELTKVNDHLYEASGDMHVSDLFEQLELEKPEPDIISNTLSGWVLEEFGHIPSPGESFQYLNLKVTVATVVDQRIVSLKIELLPEDTQEK